VVYAEELDDQGRPRRRAVGVIGDDGKAVALQEKYEEGGIGLEGGRGGMSFRERLMRAREGKGR
jgi:hypothetical protein